MWNRTILRAYFWEDREIGVWGILSGARGAIEREACGHQPSSSLSHCITRMTWLPPVHFRKNPGHDLRIPEKDCIMN